MLTSKHQTLARCSMFLLSKKYTMAFKEPEQGGQWLPLQTVPGWLPVLFYLLPLVPTRAVSALEHGPSFCSVVLLGCSLNSPPFVDGMVLQIIK